MAVASRVFVGSNALPGLIEVPGELHALADWGHMAAGEAGYAARVLKGETVFGRLANPLLRELAGRVKGKSFLEIRGDGEAMMMIRRFFAKNDPMGIRLEEADRSFMRSTEIGRAFRFEGVQIIMARFRDMDITFEDAEKLGLDAGYRGLFNEFRNVPGFRRFVMGALGDVLNFTEPWADFVTRLVIVKSLAEDGFRPVQFEGRETGIRMEGRVASASVNPDVIVEKDWERYLVELKTETAAIAKHKLGGKRSAAYSQAERYANAVKQRGYRGAILAVNDPMEVDHFTPHTLISLPESPNLFLYNAGQTIKRKTQASG